MGENKTRTDPLWLKKSNDNHHEITPPNKTLTQNGGTPSNGTKMTCNRFFLRRASPQFLFCYGLALIVLSFVVYSKILSCNSSGHLKLVSKPKFVFDNKNNTIAYDRKYPLIFIGGFPRSGTTLMRAMLDAHPDVRCGEETRVIPRILGMHNNWKRSQLETQRLLQAGITDEVIDDALSAFILEIVAKHGTAAKRLCNKDPFTLKSSVYLSKLFPNAKFILMIRDGRAVIHSVISRKVTITGFNLNDYKSCLQKWNKAIEMMYSQCMTLGRRRCLPVYYEQLVLHPKASMKEIINFLELPWDDSVLHHEDFVGKPGGISLSKTEKSTDQVVKPVYVEALTKWVGKIPRSVVNEMPVIAPFLQTLGYDPNANPPKYGEPDQEILEKTAKH